MKKLYEYLLDREIFLQSIKEKSEYEEGQLNEIKLAILKVLDILTDSKVH